jgi:hypothetical protein
MKDMLNEKEIQLLEKRIERNCENIIFDSEKDKWSMKNFEFWEKIKNKSHFSILIETTEGQKFGCYIESQVNDIGKNIYDSNAFIFNFVDDKQLIP